QVLQLLDVGVERELVALLDVAHDLPYRGAARSVEALERRVELGRNCDLRLHLASGDHAKRADRVAVRRIGQRQAELRGERFRDVALRAKAERDEERAQLFAAFLLQPERALDPRGVELAA